MHLQNTALWTILLDGVCVKAWWELYHPGRHICDAEVWFSKRACSDAHSNAMQLTLAVNVRVRGDRYHTCEKKWQLVLSINRTWRLSRFRRTSNTEVLHQHVQVSVGVFDRNWRQDAIHVAKKDTSKCSQLEILCDPDLRSCSVKYLTILWSHHRHPPPPCGSQHIHN